MGEQEHRNAHQRDAGESRPSRRDFLRATGFTATSAILASCSRAPAEKAIPYLIQPEGLTPARAYYYASTCAACSAGCGLWVKTCDGRPVKLEGNPRHPLSRGGLCAVGQASLLGLYDSFRFTQPLKEGKPAAWAEVDQAILDQLDALRRRGAALRFLSSTIISPTLRALIEGWLKGFPDARHIMYDPLSNSAMLDAHESTHGVRALPQMRFDQADVIVSFDADFLGTWISPPQFTEAYRDGRAPEAKPSRLSYHVQLESRMSLTGTKADRRIRLAPHEIGSLMTSVAARLTRLAGGSVSIEEPAELSTPKGLSDELAERLWRARGRCLVVCGVQDVGTQVIANYINDLLGSYGTTLDLEHPSLQCQGRDRALADLVRELQDGKVGALFLHGVNPLYELPDSQTLAAALRQVPLVVSMAQRPDETARLAHYVCPDRHHLESWGDAEPVSGTFSVQQPALRPFGDTRPAMESVSVWSGRSRRADELVRDWWQASVFPRQTQAATFEVFWEQVLRDGFVQVAVEPLRPKPFDPSAVRPVRSTRAPDNSFTLVLYPKTAMLDGRHAYNPWLQELPDPVTKVTWDNYACLSVSAARRLNVQDGDVVRLDATGSAALSLELPAFIQPGQHDAVVAVALGYGSALSSRFSTIAPEWMDALPSVGGDGLVGKNAAPLLELAGGVLSFSRRTVKLTKTDRVQALASTQDRSALMGSQRLRAAASARTPAARETTPGAFEKGLVSGTGPDRQEREDLWPADHLYQGHRWAMIVDLTACTGCSACVVACQAENNIAVVGKDEVRRRRAMHWLRLDRSFSGDDDAVEIALQPMLCQHCEKAPCETVCPVLATVHNGEGLNVQVYNRCVGTRFCENNCPYKVRRFNWFNYVRADRRMNLALNQNVAVRSRGVMEKCTFCVQRIQEAELEARRIGEPLADGAVQTACQQSCPARAIQFGDVNDPTSGVSQLRRSGRYYRVLEELDTRPSVGYLTAVRNRESS